MDMSKEESAKSIRTFADLLRAGRHILIIAEGPDAPTIGPIFGETPKIMGERHALWLDDLADKFASGTTSSVNIESNRVAYFTGGVGFDVIVRAA